MPTQDDVCGIALSLPETTEDPDGYPFFVDGKRYAWAWMERVEPKRARRANPTVIAVRVAGKTDKQVLLDLDPSVFFTEPHYDGYPAVLVRLGAIDLELLREIVTRAWRSRAPKRLMTAELPLQRPPRPGTIRRGRPGWLRLTPALAPPLADTAR